MGIYSIIFEPELSFKSEKNTLTAYNDKSCRPLWNFNTVYPRSLFVLVFNEQRRGWLLSADVTAPTCSGELKKVPRVWTIQIETACRLSSLAVRSLAGSERLYWQCSPSCSLSLSLSPTLSLKTNSSICVYMQTRTFTHSQWLRPCICWLPTIYSYAEYCAHWTLTTLRRNSANLCIHTQLWTRKMNVPEEGCESVPHILWAFNTQMCIKIALEERIPLWTLKNLKGNGQFC